MATNIIQPINLLMTSNTLPSGVASASSIYSAAYDAYIAFNGVADDGAGWQTPIGTTTGWLQYDFQSMTYISSYTISFRHTSIWFDMLPKAWTLKGSNDGVNFTVIDTRSGITWNTTWGATFTLSTPVIYRMYRLDITQNGGATNLGLGELIFNGIRGFVNAKTSIDSMNIGDIIACKYVAASGVFGTFSQLGTSTDTELPTASSATPNGRFYFIMVGYDSRGRKKLIADRNIQHSISWDTLDNVGVPSGSGLPITIDGTKYTMRLLTGGISAADTDNEWDKIIVGSTLGGAIIAGDNAVWNWDTVTRTATLNTGSTSGARVHRGYATASSGTVSTISTSMTSSTAVNSNGFRPMLLVDPQIRTRYVTFKNINNECYGRQ